MKSISNFISGIFSGFGADSQNNSDKHINLKRSDILLIDCRTPGEYNSGHIDGAVLIPYDIIGSKIISVAKNKDQPIALYCRSGSRSGAALRAIQELGFTNAVNYGGYSRAKNILENK
jgi:phage shock protein E